MHANSHMKKKLIYLIIGLFYCFESHAQEVIASSGDYFTQSNGSLSWTLGESISETYSNGSILTQGFQQDYENILSIAELSNNQFYSLFPNPFSSEFTLLIKNGLDGVYKLEITDSQGKIINIENYNIAQSNLPLHINVSHLASGIYYLKIQSISNENITVLKLLKYN